MIKGVLAGLVFLFVGAFPAYSNPIYMYRQSDGSIRFSNRKPPSGTNAQVFTAKKGTYTRYAPGAYYKLGAPFRPGRINSKAFSEIIDRTSSALGIDSSLIRAIIHVESAFNPWAVSPKGAKGLMQLMPGTARLVGVRNPFAAEDNIYGGTKYFAYLLKRFDGNLQYALAAYNAGPEAVSKHGGIPPYQETRDYVKNVLRMKARYSASVAG